MPGVKGQVQRRGVARREAILRAATEVFARRGYRGGSLALVADGAGLTPAGILRHFESKEALLLAVIARRDQRAAVITADLAKLPPLEMIRGIVRFAEFAEAEPGIAALFTVLEAEHLETEGEVRQFFLDRNRAIRRAIAASVRWGQREGSLRAGVDPKRVASEIVAFMEGAALVWLLDSTQSLVELYRQYLDRLADDLST